MDEKELYVRCVQCGRLLGYTNNHCKYSKPEKTLIKQRYYQECKYCGMVNVIIIYLPYVDEVLKC